MQQKENHPWNWFAPANSKTLIIGTFPPTKRNWKYDFFYPNTANLFWRMMARIAKTELQHFSGEEAVNERRSILEKLDVAISDMGSIILRNENSSLDENLSIVEYMDIFRILDENPLITKIICTSSSGKVSASKWFSEFLKNKELTHKFPKGQKPIKSEIMYNDRIIQVVIAYSPSARASNRISFERLVEIYRNEIVL
ncbi:MAG: hypothetical protein HYZ54_11200 [Ignavibacteriae bacterium]|nr:hypothetical protein [Ignavibacteriota bacterium]